MTAIDQQREARLPSYPVFIAVIATMMALTALSIDIMLPALPAMGDAYDIAVPNDRQLVVTFYFIGFAIGQLFYGPLSDAFGRKPLLFIGLAIFALASVGTLLATDYATLLAARAFQGLGGAGPRVLAIAIVRDIYGGRRMARVMSFVMMVFILVPVLAPGLGEALMLVGHWQWIFACLLAISLILIVASMLCLPETRPPEARFAFSPRWLLGAVRQILRERQTVGYTLAAGFVFGCLISYINSAQQIFVTIYGLGSLFPVAFGAVAIAIALATMVNVRYVETLGMRRLSHGALIGFVIVSVLLLASALMQPGPPPLWLFCLLLSLNLFAFGFFMPNFNALAMEPVQPIAGTASSFFGAFTTASAAAFGWAIGQQFDGTVVPMAVGYVALSAGALIIVLATERGRLLQPHSEAA